jgi:hypothetical protein
MAAVPHNRTIMASKKTPAAKAPQLGGARPGAGRKPLAAGEETVTYTVRLTVAQRDKLEALGGAAWLRKRIDLARLP